MLNEAALRDCLETLGLVAWCDELQGLLAKRFSDASHGDYARWRTVVDELRATDEHDTARRRELLLSLAPWRKGPFDVAGVHIDSEWQSDVKWNRLQDAIAPLAGRSVLDVGCGNGYYALRMREAGASRVIGIDPTLL